MAANAEAGDRILVADSAIASFRALLFQSDAELIVSFGVVGLSRIAARYSAIASSPSPALPERSSRLVVGFGVVGD